MEEYSMKKSDLIVVFPTRRVMVFPIKSAEKIILTVSPLNKYHTVRTKIFEN